MIKVAVLGYGYSAKTFHLPLIEASESLQLVSISTSKAGIVRERYPGISVYLTPQELIKSSTAELVVITTPNDSHYSLARDCLENGKHVIIEKPMASSSTQADKLLTLAHKTGLILSVFHNRRWDGDFLTARNLIQSGALGNLRLFESHFDRFRPTVRDRWREQAGAGTGILFDLGSHLLDQALCLFPRPEAITARCLSLRSHSEVTDYFHVLLHCSQCEVILHASPFSAGPNPRFHLQGSKGSFIKYGYDPQEAQLKSGLTPKNTEFGHDNSANHGVLYTESHSEPIRTEPGCYQRYYSEIAESIASGAVLPVNAEDATKVIKLLELAELSSRQGTTIQIPW